LFRELAQNIAKSTSEVIGCGVLVTDENGIIIGCDNESRLGDFHGPSVAAIRNNRPTTTSSEDAEELGNVLPGYTLPIRFYDRVIGSVSIAGLPEEVARYGLLVQKQAEMMLREQALLESKLLRERALRDLVESISMFDSRSDSAEFISVRARDLGYDISRCGAALLVQMRGWADGGAEQAFQKVLNSVASSFASPKNLICHQEDHSVIIFFAPGVNDRGTEADDAAEQPALTLFEALREQGVASDIAIGLAAADIPGLSMSLRAARDTLKIGRKLGACGAMKAKKFTLERLFSLLPAHSRGEFVDITISKLRGRGDYEDLKKTFLEWCESPFAGKDTAERLVIHRNSLQYRLKKIRSLTGKDPWNFRDAFALWAAFTMKDFD